MVEQIDVATVFELKVDGLKQELSSRGLPKTGSKIELQERLLQFVTRASNTTSAEANVEKPANEDENIDDDLSLAEANVETPTNDDENIDDDLLTKQLEQSLESDQEGTAENQCDSKEDGKDFSISDDELEYTVDEEIDGNNQDEAILEAPVEKKSDSALTKTATLNKVQTDEKPKEVKTSEFVSKKIVMDSSNEEERRLNRAKRFGCVTNETDKKKLRLDRFNQGVSTSSTDGDTQPSSVVANASGSDETKIKERIKKFGIISPLVNSSTDDKIKKRQERFGVVKPTISSISQMSDDQKKQARALKFAACTV